MPAPQQPVGAAPSASGGAGGSESAGEFTSYGGRVGTDGLVRLPAESPDGTSYAPAEPPSIEGCEHPPVEARCVDGFCAVPAGCFIMGAPRDEYGAGAYSDRQVQVTLTRGLWAQQTEVTRAFWQEVGFSPPTRQNQDETIAACYEPDCPVSHINLFEAVTFANAFSEAQDLAACYQLEGCQGRLGNDYQCERLVLTTDHPNQCAGYRLPTEAEWEYLARGTTTAFYSGDIVERVVGGGNYDHCDEDEEALNPIAWYCNNSSGSSQPVGLKHPNGWGLYDVLGNVNEHTTDIFHGLGYGEGPLVDPLGVGAVGRELWPGDAPGGSQSMMHRGGAFYGWPSLVTASDRGVAYGRPHRADLGMGLRLVQTMQ